MLELRPSCEHCSRALPPASTEAMICSFECTFCRNCVQSVLGNVCPNCGGGFAARPIRPAGEHIDGVSLAKFPASDTAVVKPVDPDRHAELAARIGAVPPESR